MDERGQGGFLAVFDKPAKDGVGIGNAPLGSRLSCVRAKAAGFNDGRARGSQTMQDGLSEYAETLGWKPDSPEALSYAEGFGDGLKLRPPPKIRDEEPEPQIEPGNGAEPAPKRSRRRASDTAAEEPDASSADTRPGWRADRDSTGADDMPGETPPPVQ